MVGLGYSLIPEKLVTKIRMGQFIDLADLLAENLKVQETEPQTYLYGKLLVTSSKKCIHEITNIEHGLKHSLSTHGFSAVLILPGGGIYDTV